MLTHARRASLIDEANAAPAVHADGVTALFHFSEDGSLRRFAPHVPATNPSHPPAVWAIDGDHAPLYWFPRDCPRISVWGGDADQRAHLAERFGTVAHRICVTELGWLDRIRAAHLYRYTFDPGVFRPWEQADGQYVSDDIVVPERVERIDDLLGLHAGADVEVRLTPRLGPFLDQVLASGLPFSCVRLRNALP